VSEDRKAIARQKIEQLKARLQALRAMASVDPQGTARLAAKLPGDRAAVERLRLGDALGEVLDALLAEEIDPEALRGAADGQDLADHWQKTLAFLELVIAVWPQARELAQQFWQNVADDARIGTEFREVARVNIGLVSQA
jgi:inactivated superfamily I helicase